LIGSAMHSLSIYIKNNILDWIQINYDHEIRPGEEVALLAKERADKDGLWQVVGNNRSKDTLALKLCCIGSSNCILEFYSRIEMSHFCSS
jgi:hypothetical protein